MIVNEPAHSALDAVQSPKPRHRLGLTGAFVVWLLIFAGMVVYLSVQ